VYVIVQVILSEGKKWVHSQRLGHLGIHYYVIYDFLFQIHTKTQLYHSYRPYLYDDLDVQPQKEGLYIKVNY
jgi:hypothetical protein